MLEYTALGARHMVTLQPLAANGEAGAELAAFAATRSARAARRPAAAAAEGTSRLVSHVRGSALLSSRVADPQRLVMVQGSVAARASHGRRSAGQLPMSTPHTMTIATDTVIAEGLRRQDFVAARDYGAEVLAEALDGKVLLRVDSVQRAFGLIELLLAREVGSVSPNFIRRLRRTRASAPLANWSHAKTGVAAAWAITRGHADLRVAVLDEGVDTLHPALQAAVAAQRDFIGGNGDSALPESADSHGTACAGIVLSRSKRYPGIAPACSLIAARIAMGDGADGWIFDDFATADAIDWCWRQGAAVLSNSWGGGAPSDAISRALARARTQGRGGLGAVVVIAAGNEQTPIDFPGDLPGYITIGASNADDQRKTRSSSDGEPWGSNYGAAMHLLAPGVSIWTTDNRGAGGDETGNFTKSFNGTSAATPAVAATAALMLAANPALSASSVRNLLAQTARKIEGQTGWTKEHGWGRLQVDKAVAAAKAAGAPSPTAAAKTAAKTAAKRRRRS